MRAEFSGPGYGVHGLVAHDFGVKKVHAEVFCEVCGGGFGFIVVLKYGSRSANVKGEKMEQKQAWKIIGKDDLSSVLSVGSNDLRRELYEANLIYAPLYWDEETPPTKEAMRRIEREASAIRIVDLMERLSDEEFKSGLSSVLSEGSADMRELVAGVEGEIVRSKVACKSARKEGGIPFDWIPFAYERGETVWLDRGAGSHAAEISSVSMERTMFGSTAVFLYRFVSHDGKGFGWARETRRVEAYSGRRTEAEIGVCEVGADVLNGLVEKGRLWVKTVGTPTYAAYEGPVARREYWHDMKYRATGRIMADIAGMRAMEPNYSGYYGDMDDYEREPVDVVSDKALTLTSPYVYGFSFTAKCWGEFLADSVSKIRFRSDAFDKLVLDPARKKLVSALVGQGGTGFADLVDGKGGGCVFLLHGSPGCGKTLTAEAIAERLERPLYMVGAGELGISPDEVEKRLKGILDLAHSWNAVLLIDECDIFLERRSASDVSRNAMVGIFLRLLEYYQGILFLTTNRVGDLDDAFLSRVSVGLHYKPLDRAGREEVWRNLSASAGLSLADAQFCGLSEREVNGRQIKHAIRLAMALAAEDGREATAEDLGGVIDLSEQFKRDFRQAKEKAQKEPGNLEA